MKDFAGLLDRDELSDICRNFSSLTGLGVSLHNPDGSGVLSYRKDGICICTILGGDAKCVRNISFSANKAAELGEPYIYICGCGLVMSASAIIVGDRLIGAVLCGPAMLWDADDFAAEELGRNIADSGLSEEDCRRIVAGTPRLTCEQMTSAARILFRLVNYMCRSRCETISQRQEITKQQATISTLLADRKRDIVERRPGFYSPETEKELLTSVRLGNRQKARRLLNDILTDIFLFSGGNTPVICARVYELTGFLFRAASEAGAAGEKLLVTARESQRILDPDIGFEELCYATTRAMEGFIDAIYENRPDIPGSRYLAEATAYLTENYTRSESMSLSAVCEVLSISPSYLSHLFTKGLGVTFTEYLAWLRIDAAKRLLRSTDLPVSEVAERVGYRDPNYFIRSFRKIVGMTPRNFRRASEGGVELSKKI